jgi:hypothetical protein
MAEGRDGETEKGIERMITFSYRNISLWQDEEGKIPAPFTVDTEEELLAKLIEQEPFLKDEKYPLHISDDCVVGWTGVGFIERK